MAFRPRHLIALVVLAALIILFLIFRPTDDAGTPSKGNSDAASEASGALPASLACDSLSEADLLPLLTVVSDASSTDTSCYWYGAETPTESGDLETAGLSLRLGEGLPASYEDANAAFSIEQDASDNGFEAHALTADGWTYGVQLTGPVDALNPDSSGLLAYYYLDDETGRTLACAYDPLFADEGLRFDEPAQDAYLTEKQPAVLAACSEELALVRGSGD